MLLNITMLTMYMTKIIFIKRIALYLVIVLTILISIYHGLMFPKRYPMVKNNKSKGIQSTLY